MFVKYFLMYLIIKQMKHKTYYFLLGLVGMVFSCKPSQSNTTDKITVDVNFSKYRIIYRDTILDLNTIKYPDNQVTMFEKSNGETVENINQKLTHHLQKIAINNQKIKYSYGYIVQIYSGGDRQEADNHIRNARSITDQEVKLEYNEPNYKVHIGNYLNRAQAYLTYTQVKEVFPSAVIIPSKIEIERYKYDKNLDKTIKKDAEETDDQK